MQYTFSSLKVGDETNSLTIPIKDHSNINIENGLDLEIKKVRHDTDSKVGAVQSMLDTLKLTLDVPLQFKAKNIPV